MKNTFIIFHGQNCSITIGNGNRLSNCKFEIFGDNNHVIIGDNNLFKESSFWLEDSGSRIKIGNNNKLCGYTHMGIAEGTMLIIENDCLFSKNLYITTTDSHSILNLQTSTRINMPNDVHISNHVWIGRDVTIGKGVAIAEDVVIGGKSYVTKSITDSNVIVAGVPAKIIKRNIKWQSERI